MLRRRIALAAAALSIAPALAGDDAPAPLKFAWPVPSKAVVTERIWKGGLTWVEKYVLSFEKQGADFKAHVDDVSIVEFAGKRPDDPSVAEYATRALPSARLKPDLLVGADGRVKDVIGLDETIEAQFEILAKSIPEARREEFHARMTSPETKDVMRRDAMKNWQAWTGDWIGLSLVEGKDVSARSDVHDIDGKEREAPCVVRREASKTSGLVQLTRVATLEGDDTKASLDAWIKMQSARTGQVPPPDLFTGLTLTNRMAADVDPQTLRPADAIREYARVIHRKDRPDFVDPTWIERHEFKFEWVAAAQPKSDK